MYMHFLPFCLLSLLTLNFFISVVLIVVLYSRPSSTDVTVHIRSLPYCSLHVRGMFLELLSASDIVLQYVMEAEIVMTRMMHSVLSNLVKVQALSSNNTRAKTYCLLCPNIESCSEEWITFTQYGYCFAVISLHVFANCKEHCLRPQEAVLCFIKCACSSNTHLYMCTSKCMHMLPQLIPLQHFERMDLICCGQFTKGHEILPGLWATLFHGQRWQVDESSWFVCKVDE